MLNAKLLERQEVAKGLFIIKVKTDFDVPHFLPGQYATLGLPEESAESEKPVMIRRAYSVVSPPSEKDYVEFYFALVPDGELTPKIDKLAPGDPLYIAPKFIGTFTVDKIESGKDVALIATGTAIGPYLSMLRDGEILDKAASITVAHGVRHGSDLAYREELLQFAEDHEKVTYLAAVSRPDSNWQGDSGYVGQYLQNGAVTINPENTHVFLCGNPAMIKENEAFLAEKGYSVNTRKNPEGKLHLEKYW